MPTRSLLPSFEASAMPAPLARGEAQASRGGVRVGGHGESGLWLRFNPRHPGRSTIALNEAEHGLSFRSMMGVRLERFPSRAADMVHRSG